MKTLKQHYQNKLQPMIMKYRKMSESTVNKTALKCLEATKEWLQEHLIHENTMKHEFQKQCIAKNILEGTTQILEELIEELEQ